MPRLPQPGGDDGTWGQVLNDFLSQTHNTDGTLKSSIVQASNLAPNAVSNTALASSSVTNSTLAVSGGSDGQVLTKDSTQSGGIKWATAAASASAATTTSLGTIQLAGDLAGSATSPTVPALASKEPTIAAGTTGQYYRGDKTWQPLDNAAVGLGNVNDTADVDKPISSATQIALNAKANTSDLGTKTLLITNAAALPAGTPAGVIVIVQS